MRPELEAALEGSRLTSREAEVLCREIPYRLKAGEDFKALCAKLRDFFAGITSTEEN